MTTIMPSFPYRQSRAYREILELTEKLPNDQELGLKVRALISEYQKPHYTSYNCYEPDRDKIEYEPTPFDNYMKYVKDITDKFAEMLSAGNDYLDHINTVQGNDPGTFYNFRNANTQTLIDMMLSHTFEDSKEVMEKIEARQEEAKAWLSNNIMTFEEWTKKLNTEK